MGPYAFCPQRQIDGLTLHYERKGHEKRNSFKEKANNQKLLRYFLFLHVFHVLRLAHTGIFMLNVALVLLSRFFFMFYFFKAFLTTVIAVNINRVGMLSSTVKRSMTIETEEPCLVSVYGLCQLPLDSDFTLV